MNIKLNNSWRSRLGLRYENLALRYLRKHGLVPVWRNYRCKLGEIDLIMCSDKALVFVEVRYRSRSDYGGALATITPAKQRKLINTAQHFLLCHKIYNRMDCRFDVVCIGTSPDGSPSIEWIPNAFP